MKRAVLLALLALLPGLLYAQGLSLPAPAGLPATLPTARPAEALPLAELESPEWKPTFESFGPLAAPLFVSKRFTGKERDTESGLDYFGARYCSAPQGRFTSPDPVFMLDEHIVDPQQWNRYAYVRNNPLRYVDENGEVIKEALEVSQREIDTVVKPLILSAYPVAQAFGVGTIALAGAVGGAIGGALYLNVYAYEQEKAAELRMQEQLAGLGSDRAIRAQKDKEQRQATQTGNANSTTATDKEFAPEAGGAGSRSGGGRTGRKSNVDRVASAQAEIANLRARLNELTSTRNKTPETKEEIERVRRQINRQEDRIRTSEEHARTRQR